MNSGFKFDNKINQWLPVPTSLTLICGGKQVGTVKFDLTEYIDKKAEIEKTTLINKNSFAKPAGKAFFGDTSNYPGAYITFQITITQSSTVDRKSVMVKRRKSFLADQAAVSRLTMNQMSAGLEQGDADDSNS